MSKLFENEEWKNVVKDSSFSPPSYRKYMKEVNDWVKAAEYFNSRLDEMKEMSNMTYEEWLTRNNGYKNKDE